MTLIAHKKQLAKVLEVLEKFRDFLLKKQAFSQKIGVVMQIFDETDQKKLEQKKRVKVS